GGRIGQAAAASRVGTAGEGEGLAAAGAGRPAEKIQRRPAAKAEQMWRSDDHAAARTARRQGEIERHGDRPAPQGGDARDRATLGPTTGRDKLLPLPSPPATSAR